MSTPPQLRGYQVEALDKVRASYRAGRNAPLLCAPCGSGKTVMFAHICAGAAAKGNRVVILSHRTELVDQISAALSAENCEHSYIAAGYPYVPDRGVYVASVMSLVRRLDACRPDLIVIDECHHAAAGTWRKVLGSYPGARVLGVTASPIRLSGEGLDDIFDDLILGPNHEELIRQGYLTSVRVFAPPTIDTAGLHSRAGDFVSGEIDQRSNRPHVTGDCIEHLKRISPQARTIVFDTSVDSARRRAVAFRDAGFTAEFIGGETPRDVRALAVADFRAGRLQILVSVDIISEGFDLPAVEVGIGLRPTQSLGLHLQQTGRVLRPFPGKTAAIFFDHAGNTLRHGLPTETRSWSLAGLDKVSDGSKRGASLRTCPSCFAVSPVGSPKCQECGYIFPIKGREVSQVDGTLEEVVPLTTEQIMARVAARNAAQRNARTLEQLVALGRERGMRSPYGWALHVLQARAKKGRVG